MKIFAYMERGSGKECSEDTMSVNGQLLKEGFFSFESSGNCVAVADGVGGNAGGREASEFVVNKFKDGIEGNAKTTAEKINADLISYAMSVPGKEQMATTLSAMLFNDAEPSFIIHIGNTRVSAIQGEYLKQLTNDHTTVEFLKCRGDFEAAERAPKNEITACFGSGNPARLNQLQIIEIDRSYAGYVITSDGIHDYLDEEVIEDFISNGCFTELAFKGLFRQAKECGSSDDKSIVVVRLWE